jgi:hypothetical protein
MGGPALIADELTTAVDVTIQQQILALVNELRRHELRRELRPRSGSPTIWGSSLSWSTACS